MTAQVGNEGIIIRDASSNDDFKRLAELILLSAAEYFLR